MSCIRKHRRVTGTFLHKSCLHFNLHVIEHFIISGLNTIMFNVIRIMSSICVHTVMSESSFTSSNSHFKAIAFFTVNEAITAENPVFPKTSDNNASLASEKPRSRRRLRLSDNSRARRGRFPEDPGAVAST